jgi:hypothetical protein
VSDAPPRRGWRSWPHSWPAIHGNDATRDTAYPRGNFREDYQLVDCKWSFEGPAASLLQLFRTMYGSDGGKRIVEGVFANIRAGTAAAALDLPTGTMRH